MLGPLLTADNLVGVLARAKHRTKKELARLVRILDPPPQIPPRIEPLALLSEIVGPGLILPARGRLLQGLSVLTLPAAEAC
jgi:hypothetical protein